MIPELRREDASVVEAIAAKDRSNLYLTSQFFAERERYQAFTAMYAVMRLIDDAIDDVADKDQLTPERRQGLHRELDGWTRRIESAYEGHPGDSAIDRALAWALRTFAVPRELWRGFVEAMHFDVDHARFPDFETFLRYCEGATVAPTTIYLFLLISERGDDGAHRVADFDYRDCGRHLGIFAYLAHILRDVRVDALVGERGLVYISEADLAAVGLADHDLRGFAERGRGDPRFDRVVEQTARRARPLEARGVELVSEISPHLPLDRRFILHLIVASYQLLLERVAAPGTELFAGDVLISGAEKLRLLRDVSEEVGFPLSAELLARVGEVAA